MRLVDLEEPIDLVAACRYLAVGPCALRRLARAAGLPKRYRYYQDSHNRPRRVRVLFPSEIALLQTLKFGKGIYGQTRIE